MAEQTIKLTWDGITNDVMSDPETVDLVAGDTLVFRSDQGPVNLNFDPPGNFGIDRVVDGAVHVVVLNRAPARITCGITVDGITRGFPVEALKSGVKTTPSDGKSDGGDGSGGMS